MIRYFILILLLCVSFAVLPCTAESSEHIWLSKKSAKPANPYENPYDARSHRHGLEIFKGEKQVCEISLDKGALIKQWGFIDKGNYVVVRSIGKEKKTIFQLFETGTCKCVDKVTASEVKADKMPLWVNALME